MSKVVKVLSSAKSAAPEMTHCLKELGKGSMGKGVNAVFGYGVAAGVLLTVIVGSTVGIVFIVRKAKKVVQEECANVCDEEAETFEKTSERAARF